MYTSMYTHGSLFFSTIGLGFMLLTKSTTAGNVMFQYSRLPLVLPPQNYIFENKIHLLQFSILCYLAVSKPPERFWCYACSL